VVMVDGALGATTLLSDRMRWISRLSKEGFNTEDTLRGSGQAECAEGTEQETELEELVMVAVLDCGEGNWCAIALRGMRAGGELPVACVPQAISRFGFGDPGS
jgi:hypothetical protein